MTDSENNAPNVESSFLTSAELEKIHTLHRRRLREQLSQSLEEHVAKARDQVAKEARDRLNDSFQRTLERFTHIERELVLTLNRVLTGKYEGILADLKDRNNQLYQHIKALREFVAFSTRRTKHSEAKELVSEILMALLVITIPAMYTCFAQIMTTTALQYIVPSFYICMVAGLLYWRYTFSRLRKSEAQELDRMVADKEKAAKHLSEPTPADEPPLAPMAGAAPLETTDTS